MRRVLSLVLAMAILFSLGMVGGVTAFAASELVMSDEGIEMIKSFEGFSDKPYWDYAQWTVGYGTRCPDDKVDEYKANGITEEEAELLLREHIAEYQKEVNYFATKNDLTLTQNQFDALVSFTYNLGSGWIYESSNNLKRTLTDPDATDAEVIYWMSAYCTAGGSMLNALIRRRLAEVNLYLNGVYSTGRPSNYCYVKLDANGGSVNSRLNAYDINTSDRITPKVSRDGYVFEGWYTAASDGAQVTTLDSSVHGKTLYAHWSKDPNSSDSSTEDEDDTATEETVDITVTVTNSFVNLRKGPGTNYTKIGEADKGDRFTITKTATGGAYLWGCYGEGWLALKYTNYDDILAGAEEDTETEESTSSQKGTVKVSSALSIRSGPGTGYSRVGWLYNKDRVTILEQRQVGSMTWGKISKGWVSMDYIVLDQVETEPEQTVPETTEPEVTEPEVTEPEVTEPEATEPEATEPEETTPETDAQEGIKVTVTNSYVNLRKGPGTGYSKAGVAYKGDTFVITETKVNGLLWGCYGEGWLALMYTDYEDVLAGETTPEEPEETGVMGTVKVSNGLSIRKGPGTSYARVGYLYNNNRVEILEQKQVGSTTWGRISKGWISLDYVVLDAASSQGSASDQETPDDSAAEDNTTNDNTANDSATEDNTASDAQTITGTVDVADFLRIRSGAGTSYSIAGYLHDGDKVTITELKVVGSTTWGRIDKGWISLDYVELDGQISDSENETRTVTASCLRVRKSAGTDSQVVGYLYTGAKVEILETATVNGVTWGRVSNGWISLEYTK